MFLYIDLILHDETSDINLLANDASLENMGHGKDRKMNFLICVSSPVFIKKIVCS